MESSVILSGHSARFRGNFAIHFPGESDAKFKTLQIQSYSSLLPVITSYITGLGQAKTQGKTYNEEV
ncbi:hypothetical protein BMS3Bbin06_01807 [bacterium BMS3Bbin06]|nr:hypothetical protein BMS3Bbin06_01807 [bacterium BMS3Bbin06]